MEIEGLGESRDAKTGSASESQSAVDMCKKGAGHRFHGFVSLLTLALRGKIPRIL